MLNTKHLTWEQLVKEGFTVIKDKNGNKRVDFKKPPRGKKFAPLPTNEADIRTRDLDTRFVTKNHRFSATKVTVFMDLVDEDKDGAGVDNYIAYEKVKAKQEERKNRCRYINPETGNETYCQDCISCYSDKCPKKQGIEVFKYEYLCLDNMSEILKVEGSMEDNVIGKMEWETFKKELRDYIPMLADIVEWDEIGYKSDEIILKCGKQKKDTSWYGYQWKRIANRYREFKKGWDA